LEQITGIYHYRVLDWGSGNELPVRVFDLEAATVILKQQGDRPIVRMRPELNTNTQP
jgi:hypothetical protein